jgi:hypothetical protein
MLFTGLIVNTDIYNTIFKSYYGKGNCCRKGLYCAELYKKKVSLLSINFSSTEGKICLEFENIDLVQGLFGMCL